MSKQAKTDEQYEADVLVAWRTAQFDEMGFAPNQIVQLIEWQADYHTVKTWLDGGCSRSLVMKLLRPLV